MMVGAEEQNTLDYERESALASLAHCLGRNGNMDTKQLLRGDLTEQKLSIYLEVFMTICKAYIHTFPCAFV